MTDIFSIEPDRTFIIGAGPGAHYRITGDPYISTAHAAITQKADGTLWIADLGSTNGTRITRGGTELRVTTATQLLPGDIITIGRTRLPWTPR